MACPTWFDVDADRMMCGRGFEYVAQFNEK